MLYLKSYVCFEGEDDGGDDGDDAAAAAAKTAEDAKNVKKFTQDELNTVLAREKRKTQTAQKQLAGQLEDQKKKLSANDEEREILQKQIDELESKYMTAEELAQQAADKASKQHTEEVKSLIADRDTWQSRFTRATIDVEIAGAAVANKAISTEQIAAILRPKTSLCEKTDDDGKPNGAFESRVKFNDTDKDGKAITLDLTVPEAVKRMSELSTYGNLFISDKTAGLGGSGNQNKQGKIDLAKIARTDPAQYRKLRKERPELFAQL